MAITQNDLEILKSEIMADTPDGGGLPTGVAVIDGVSNNLFPDVSDIDRLLGRVRLRKVSLAVKTANAELLQATRMLFTELPDNPNISVFAFKATSFADRRSDAQNKIESYLAFGTKWAGHLLETQLAGQRVIQISLDAKDPIPAVGQPLVLVQNEGQSDEFYQYIRPLKVDTVERRFQKSASETVTRTVATIEFGDTLNKSFNGLTVQEFYQNTSTTRRAILREARIADAAKYYSASRLADPVVAMQSNQVRLNSIYTQVVPSTQVETPILQRDPANQVATQVRGGGAVVISQSVNIAPNTAFSLPSGIAAGSLSLAFAGLSLIDRNGELVDSASTAYASIKYSSGQITWYSTLNLGQTTISGSYTPALEFNRVAQTDYQIVGDNAGYNYVRELMAEPVTSSLKISYSVGVDAYYVHDDGRGNLVDDDGNGRGTLSGKTVLLTTAAIPDAGSFILYSFGVDLSSVKYGQKILTKPSHSIVIDDEVVGDITATWGADKTATINNTAITGDATGSYSNGQLDLAPNITLAPLDNIELSYQRLTADNVIKQEFKNSGAITSQDIGQTTHGDSKGFKTVYTGSQQLGQTVSDMDIEVAFYDGLGAALKVVLSTLGTNKLVVTKMYHGTTKDDATVWVNYREGGAANAWKVDVASSAVDKSIGKANFVLEVYRNYEAKGVYVGQESGFNFANGLFGSKLVTVTGTYPYNKSYGLNATYADVTLKANTGGVTELATKTVSARSLNILLGQDDVSPIVRNSVFFKAIGDNLKDSDGSIFNGSVKVGTIDYRSGIVSLNSWTVGVANSAELLSMVRENDPAPLANIVFRTPSSPLKNASLQISCELADGAKLLLATDDQGNITGSKYAHGVVDFKAGIVLLYFYEKLGVTANPSIINESWYDAANIYMESGTNYINKPIYVKPDSIRYNAIAYSYLPLDKELIGLDPVRLPTDGRVPFVRKGDSIAITELKAMELPTNAPNDTFDLGFERLSDVNVVDSTGKKVSFDYLDVDLDAGTLKLNGLLDMSFYTAPLTAKYRIMDIALVIETDISGRVTLSTPITHDYSTAAVFSSMLLAGDMQARAYNVFGQKSWGSVWSNTLIGDATTSQLQITNNPIVVTNRDAIEERWALVFTGTTSFRIIGETVGEIGIGSTSTTTSPLNPMTGQPYFTIPQEAWGSGWSANNVVRLNTASAKYPIWIGNAIQQHQGSSSDNYDFTIGYHANIDRERV